MVLRGRYVRYYEAVLNRAVQGSSTTLSRVALVNAPPKLKGVVLSITPVGCEVLLLSAAAAAAAVVDDDSDDDDCCCVCRFIVCVDVYCWALSPALICGIRGGLAPSHSSWIISAVLHAEPLVVDY